MKHSFELRGNCAAAIIVWLVVIPPGQPFVYSMQDSENAQLEPVC